MGKYTIHGSYGKWLALIFPCFFVCGDVVLSMVIEKDWFPPTASKTKILASLKLENGFIMASLEFNGVFFNYLAKLNHTVDGSEILHHPTCRKPCK